MNSHWGSWSLKWTFESSESNCKGQNSMDWAIPYIIENILERRCLKWARMTHLNIWNTSYGQTKGQESNWQFDSWPLKVRNHLNFLAFRWHATCHWKSFDEGYNFASNLITIRGLHVKLWAPQSCKSPNYENSKTPTWESWDKNAIWMWALWRGTKYIIRGKVVASPKSRPWWVLWVRGCPWFILTLKVFKLCNNQLVDWFV
jgi:hypothetical protein